MLIRGGTNFEDIYENIVPCVVFLSTILLWIKKDFLTDHRCSSLKIKIESEQSMAPKIASAFTDQVSFFLKKETSKLLKSDIKR